ncbi:phosphate ABC transporter substrate-binding protein, PhoT family [Oribacterium sp. KHPX15]|uniref:PstS family phosphate ABC transporter substrate-binding protein n=1 Tax=Oribacterium sp. KHPX15 TaxID=1855342 RepID=UPI00089A5880|nr:substrate-binding domain-containing protein [Oribacterium sp. KHPX15]SEA93959.1 phosphate ABC transporter substrate-binding protein, PhoT family [Oribacterium sp. KHPX15]
MRKTVIIIAVISFFVFVNVFLYITLTSRLENNYSGVSQTKMVDVAKYIPFEETSDLAKTGSSLHFSNDDDLPVLDGAAALVPVYASIIDSVYPEGSVTYEGGTFSDDNKYGENFAEDSVMQYQNTIRGFDALLDGSVDLFFTAHPSENQLNTAKEKGIEIELVPVGLEAFVFFVNKNNPVESLTIDEIRGIYRGNITNWKDVGGPDRIINPLLRIKNSGSQTMMEKFMENDMIKSRGIFAVFGASIGYSFRYYLSGMVANDNVKMLAVNGIYPDASSIRNGLYPLTSSFYVAYRKDNPNPNVKKLVDWILSPEGQRLIEGCGYVAIDSR